MKLVSTRNWNFTFAVYDFTFNGMDNNNDNGVDGDTSSNNNVLENNDNVSD